MADRTTGLAVKKAPSSLQADYAAYASAVRREYASVSDAAWQFGRVGVLNRFLVRFRIYQTRDFDHGLEAIARGSLSEKADALRTRA